MLLLLEGKVITHGRMTFNLDPDDKTTRECLEILVKDDDMINKYWPYIDTDTGIIRFDEEKK